MLDVDVIAGAAAEAEEERARDVAAKTDAKRVEEAFIISPPTQSLKKP